METATVKEQTRRADGGRRTPAVNDADRSQQLTGRYVQPDAIIPVGLGVGAEDKLLAAEGGADHV